MEGYNERGKYLSKSSSYKPQMLPRGTPSTAFGKRGSDPGTAVLQSALEQQENVHSLREMSILCIWWLEYRDG